MVYGSPLPQALYLNLAPLSALARKQLLRQKRDPGRRIEVVRTQILRFHPGMGIKLFVDRNVTVQCFAVEDQLDHVNLLAGTVRIELGADVVAEGPWLNGTDLQCVPQLFADLPTEAFLDAFVGLQPAAGQCPLAWECTTVQRHAAQQIGALVLDQRAYDDALSHRVFLIPMGCN